MFINMSGEFSYSLANCKNDGEDYLPSAEELEGFYLQLEGGGVLELEWQCHGRRLPSPDCSNNDHQESKVSMDTMEIEETMKINDFDFSDDIAQPQMRVRNQNSTPKSAKKKTANFAGVMEVLKKKNAEGTN